MKWLCDTNVISELFKRTPNNLVLEWLTRHDIVFLSVITVEEIYCGLSHKNANRKMEWFDKFVQLRCEILSLTHNIAKQCGVLRGHFLQKGISRTQADLFIAATAVVHNLTLATRNVRDFENCGIPILNPFA